MRASIADIEKVSYLKVDSFDDRVIPMGQFSVGQTFNLKCVFRLRDILWQIFPRIS